MIPDKFTVNMLTDEQLEAFGRRIAQETWDAARRFFEEQRKGTENMMTLAEVMKFYRCGRSSIYTKIRNGELHPKKVGGKNLFCESEVKFYEQECLRVS